ncbi:DUF6284 family protein [Streptomyces sp. NPDC002514]|uniref:DUF6284 family protein n=1 Tax=Streptomyces sp. NPDC001270 TaxID=3364554 RepID=UPI0036BC77DD
MPYIDAGQDGVTASRADREPTAAELADIQREMPVIEAEIELLDAEITALGRVRSHLDERRLRRAERRLLEERRRLAAEQRKAAREAAEVTVTARARRYPLPPPAAGDDPRFSFGLLVDVTKVLEEHAYPPVTAGRDLLELQLALFRYLYAAEQSGTDAVGGGAA